jgi:parallel beta-helix repeat protein
MKKVKCLVVFVVSLFVLGSLGISTYAVADPDEENDIYPAPEGAEDLVPTAPESPSMHREISMGEESSKATGGQGQTEGGNGGGTILQTVDWPDGHICTGDETYTDDIINLGGDLILTSNCHLTIDNTELVVNEEVREVEIDVQESGGVRGWFEIKGGSHVKPDDPKSSNIYEFSVDGKVTVSGSTIEGLQGGLTFKASSIGIIESSSSIEDSESHVVQASSPDTLDIVDSTISGGGYYGGSGHGVYVNGGEDNVYIYNTEIYGNDDYGIYVYGSGPKLVPEPVPTPPIKGTRFGYFIWVTDNYWHIEWSTVNGTTVTFNGSVNTPSSNNSFNETVTYGGGSANYDVDDNATLDLWVNGSRVDEDYIFVSKYEENPTSNPFVLEQAWMIVEHQCYIHDNWGGIYVENSSPVIKGNDIESNTQYGISVKEASPAIDGNDLENNNYGIYGKSSSSHNYAWSYSPKVFSNYVYMTGAMPSYTAGMLFDDYSFPRVRYNSLDGPFTSYAMAFNVYTNGEINENNVTRSPTAASQYGIYVYGASSPLIYDNYVEHIPYGIMIAYYSASEITSNHVTDSWLGIYMYSSGNSDVTIAYNHVDNCTSRGIDLRASTADVLNNNVRDNLYGIASRESNYPLIQDNTVRFNSRDGILLYDNSDATVKGNTVTNNTWSGICLCPYPSGYDDPGSPVLGGDTSADENKLYSNGRWGIELTYNEPTNSAKDDNYFEDNGDGWVVQYWWLDVTVKKRQGQSYPVVEGATVELREYEHYSDQDPYWSGLTDENGETGKIKLREYYVDNNGDTTDCTPHQIYAYKDNKEGFEYPTMDQNRDDYEVIIS